MQLASNDTVAALTEPPQRVCNGECLQQTSVNDEEDDGFGDDDVDSLTYGDDEDVDMAESTLQMVRELKQQADGFGFDFLEVMPSPSAAEAARAAKRQKNGD